MQEGSVPVTITVDDGKSGTATDTVTIQVIKPPVKEYTFEDVHFDFDRYSLRPEAVRILDEAIRAMRDDATLRLEIEGHTCSIGTAEYNLALGERRATAVRDYLTSRGVDRRPAPHRELRRGAAEARQRARRDAPPEPARAARRAAAAVASPARAVRHEGRSPQRGPAFFFAMRRGTSAWASDRATAPQAGKPCDGR